MLGTSILCTSKHPFATHLPHFRFHRFNILEDQAVQLLILSTTFYFRSLKNQVLHFGKKIEISAAIKVRSSQAITAQCADTSSCCSHPSALPKIWWKTTTSIPQAFGTIFHGRRPLP